MICGPASTCAQRQRGNIAPRAFAQAPAVTDLTRHAAPTSAPLPMSITSPPARTGAEPIGNLVEQLRTTVDTPYYLIDESRLLPNLERIALLRERSGARCVLALKCFSTWSVFDLMRPYLDGTTSSSVYEARLGAERFGKEVHAYSVAFSDEEFDQIRSCATKIIFNSVSRRTSTRSARLPRRSRASTA